MAANEKAARMLDTSGAAQENLQVNFTVTRRQIKLLAALQLRPTPREALDAATGASNSPSLVMKLRRKGLEIPCERLRVIDAHGQLCRPGIYSLSTTDKIKLHFWRT
ncbi:MAG: hypothetical protein Q7U05_06945 [Polaromonas sp.]|nr:hypothetical protein [Polaromonas sp.]